MFLVQIREFEDHFLIILTEVLLILKGKLRVDFYNNKKKYLHSKIVNSGDILILIKGSHGFKSLSPIEMLEIKQGPYKISKDKIKFNQADEKRIDFGYHAVKFFAKK